MDEARPGIGGAAGARPDIAGRRADGRDRANGHDRANGSDGTDRRDGTDRGNGTNGTDRADGTDRTDQPLTPTPRRLPSVLSPLGQGSESQSKEPRQCQ